MHFLKLSALIVSFISCSCLTKLTSEEKEINIGEPTAKFKLNTEGNDLVSYINTKLLSDSSRNLISQLGRYKFSTSLDPLNAFDNRYNPDAFIYYDYQGLQLKYVFIGGGSFQRNELAAKMAEFKKYVFLDEITIEPKLYKGTLPKGLTCYSTSSEVEKILGKHNPHFDGGGSTSKVNFTYPELGLRFLFDQYAPAYPTDDSTILFITISDSIKEMKSYPTIYPKYGGSQR
ncbi:MAG: hypothetical protein JNJ41_19025 [Bacteroidia bacterium]|nr:hypothetical protein [Bacteroidia bacterium]